MRASKFFALVIALFSFTIISFISLSSGYSIDPLSFNNAEKWVKQLINESWEIKLEDIKEDETEVKWKIFVNNISLLDSVYYTIEATKDIDVRDNEKWNVFRIWKWIYAFILNDINKDQKIVHEGFILESLSTWKIYIDSRNPRKTLIYSADMVIDVKLQDMTDKKEVTDFVMYPHNIFTLNITRNKFLKKADLLRISTIFNISYIPEAIFWAKWSIEPKFVAKLWADKEESSKEFLEIFLTFLKFKEEQVKKQYDKIHNLEIAWLKDEELVDKYFNVFVNNDKKVVYYQNKILKNINILFTLEEDIPKKLQEEIVENFKSIKAINKEDYNKTLEVLNWYYNVLVYYNSLDLFPNKLALSQIIEKIEWNENAFYEKYMYLNSVFSSYDTDKIKKKELYKYISYLLDEYYFDNKNEIIWTEYNKKSLESFSFLFTKMFEHNFDLSSEYAMSNLNLLQKYIKINNFLLVASDKSTKKTYLYIYDNLFRKFIDEFYKNYFESSRDDRELLVLKNYDNKDVYKEFKEIIYSWNSSIYRFISRYSYLFSDDIKKKDFIEFRDKIKEYFAATDDYNLYEQNYYEPAKIWAKTEIVWSKKDYSLTKEKFEEYFSQFRNISYNLDNLEIDELAEKYTITNVWVGNKTISFDLYPYQRNRIENFTVNWEKKNYAYKLDAIKPLWKKRFDEEEDYSKKLSFDFSLFFINTFKEKKQEKIDEYIKKEDRITDSKVELVFKRDRLLWPSWEFRNIKKMITIEYWDIKLSTNEKTQTYDIKIKDALIEKSIQWKSSWQVTYKANFNSDYIFSDDHHKFENILLYFYESRGNDEFFDRYTYYEKPLTITWTINITEFKEKTEQILEGMFYMRSLYNVIKTNYSSDLEMDYDLKTKQFNISYKDRKWSLVQVKLDSNWKVSKFTINNRSLVTSPIQISGLYNLDINK